MTNTATPTNTRSATPTPSPTPTISPTPGQECLNFDLIVPTSGQISYPVTGGTLSGTGIDVDTVIGLGTPLNADMAHNCIGCTLTFTTGDLTGTDGDSWFFGPGGVIQLVGGVDLDGDNVIGPGDIPLTTTLISGTFDGTTIVQKLSGTLQIVGGSFQDTKDARLLNFYGLPDVTLLGGLNLGFTGSASPPATFTSSQVLSGNLTNCTP